MSEYWFTCQPQTEGPQFQYISSSCLIIPIANLSVAQLVSQNALQLWVNAQHKEYPFRKVAKKAKFVEKTWSRREIWELSLSMFCMYYTTPNICIDHLNTFPLISQVITSSIIQEVASAWLDECELWWQKNVFFYLNPEVTGLVTFCSPTMWILIKVNMGTKVWKWI